MREKRRAEAREAEAARVPPSGNGDGKGEAKSAPAEKTPPVVPETS
jgi:hypothetical protein